MPPLNELIAYFIAVAIPIFYVYLVFSLDLFGTSKLMIVMISLAWGATGAFIPAYYINTAIGSVISFSLVVAITAPILEELLKSIILVYYVRQPAFRYVVDGAIYGFAVGIGFAAIENITYVQATDQPALTLAISRVLSAALMHATASGIVGLALGSLRRVENLWRRRLDYGGILLAIALHMGYNNALDVLDGVSLLLVAIAIGIVGGVTIGYLINQELTEEKERFNVALGLHVDVSSGEVKAIQKLGSTTMENIFGELSETFGAAKINTIRRLLATQANIGILENNLKGNASERLRKAWKEEIVDLQAEVKRLRQELGVYVTNFMESVFPASDDPMWQQELGNFDPTLVHTFDTFMRLSELAESFTPEKLMELAERLSHTDIFKNVSLANLENLSRAITIQEFSDGDILFDQGDPGDAMYLVEDGGIDIVIMEDDGSERLLKTLEAGKVVGEFSVLDGETRSARAKANGQLKVLSLNREVFYMFIRSRPQVIVSMLQMLAGKARVTTASVEESITDARLIAEGKYETLTATAAIKIQEILKPDTQPVEMIEEPEFVADDGEVTAIKEDTPERLKHTFAQVAAVLAEQERRIKEKLAD